MLRSLTDRLTTKTVRPLKPRHDDHPHHHRHHAVHLAVCWLHQLTDADLKDLHDRFASHHHAGTKMDEGELAIAQDSAMKVLYDHSAHLDPRTYAAIYHMITRGS